MRQLHGYFAAIVACLPLVTYGGDMNTTKDSTDMQILMNTPANAFSMLMYLVYDDLKCHRGVYGNPRVDKDKPCMTLYPHYDKEANIIHFQMFVTESYEPVSGFDKLPKSRKQEVLEAVVRSVSQDLAIEETATAGKMGVLQNALSRVLGNPGGMLIEIEEGISDIIHLEVTLNYNGSISKAVRNPNGDIAVAIDVENVDETDIEWHEISGSTEGMEV